MEQAFEEDEYADMSAGWIEDAAIIETVTGLFEFAAGKTDRLTECLPFVLKWEGGYSNHPSDRGGATMRGIIQSVYDLWRRAAGLPSAPVKEISDSDVREIYRRRYWILSKANLLPAPLDLIHFDTAVNCGTNGAAKLLQRSLGIKADGVIGPVTLAAVRSQTETGAEVKALCDEYIDRRDQRYRDIVAGRASQEVFLNGWLNRTKDLRKAAGLT